MLRFFTKQEVVVDLPHRFNRDTMYNFIDQVIDENGEPKHSKVKFNFSTLTFIEPIGVAVLSNVIEWLHKRKVKCSFENHTATKQAIKYLDDSKFFERYLKHKQFAGSDIRSTTIPLQLVKHECSHSWLENNLIPWLSARLSLSEGSLSSIKVCCGEIFNNIDDHAQEDIGCIFVQHYPKLSTIQIAISDFGVGIPYNVAKKVKVSHDGAAILMATKEGFSTHSNSRNRGAGLDILINSVVGHNQGSVFILSNNGVLTCASDHSGIKRTPKEAKGFYPGTLFQINLRTDTIENIVDVEEPFEW